MGRFRGFTGVRFGQLTVVELAFKDARSKPYWRCACDCGGGAIIRADALARGQISCGCVVPALARDRATIHGWANTPTYKSWNGMFGRTTNPNREDFKRYGGRGIRVCDRWLEFENFLADMGERPSPGMTLDRIDNDGDYEPGNCRWATSKQQQRNKRTTRLLTLGNETRSLAEWAENTGLATSTIFARLQAGWPEDRALTRPLRGQREKR